MDFDPGFHEEMCEENYDEGYEDGQNDTEDVQEDDDYDEWGNPLFLATAVGMGYHMARDEAIEQEAPPPDQVKKEQTKIPLSQRKQKKGYVTPFGRWSTKMNEDPKKTEDKIEYTLEEQLAIIRAEADEEW